MSYFQFVERIKEYFNFRTDADLEKAVGIGGGYCWKLKNNKIKTPDAILIWLKKQKLNQDFFLTGDGTPELQDINTRLSTHIEEDRIIPFLSQTLSAGSGEELLAEIQIDRFIGIPRDSRFENKKLYALVVRGDSMYPTFSDGDIVVCDADGFQGDGVYAIRTHDLAFVKRIAFRPNEGYQVMSDNKEYPPYQQTEDTEVVGKVCAVFSRF